MHLCTNVCTYSTGNIALSIKKVILHSYIVAAVQRVLEADTKSALADHMYRKYFACFPTGTPGVALPAIDNTYYSVYVAVLLHVPSSCGLFTRVYACIPST